MEPAFVKLLIELIKVVYKIIEGTIRGLLEVTIQAFVLSVCMGFGLILAFYFIR